MHPLCAGCPLYITSFGVRVFSLEMKCFSRGAHQDLEKETPTIPTQIGLLSHSGVLGLFFGLLEVIVLPKRCQFDLPLMHFGEHEW